MAGYSGTPLPKKLGIKPDHVVALLDAPEGVPGLLEPLPADVELRHDARARADVTIVFCATLAVLRRRAGQLWRLAHPDHAVWIAWPKKSSGAFVDLTEDHVREIALPLGLVDVKVCAIDDTWSGLKLVVRKQLR